MKQETIINDFVMENLIYCGDTHSFVHRLYDKFRQKMPGNKSEAQEVAWQVIKEMNKAEVTK